MALACIGLNCKVLACKVLDCMQVLDDMALAHVQVFDDMAQGCVLVLGCMQALGGILLAFCHKTVPGSRDLDYGGQIQMQDWR